MPWAVFSATRAGRPELKPNGDACHHAVVAGGALVLALADGAGAAARGAQGAALAVEASVSFLERSLSETPLSAFVERPRLATEALRAAREAIVHAAVEASAPLSDYSTTLLVIIATAREAIATQIGDSLAFWKNPRGRYVLACRPKPQPYPNTPFLLTDVDYADHLSCRAVRYGPRSILLATDGIARLLVTLPKLSPHEPFFRWLSQAMGSRSPQTVLDHVVASPETHRRTDDDVTLLYAQR